MMHMHSLHTQPQPQACIIDEIELLAIDMRHDAERDPYIDRMVRLYIPQLARAPKQRRR